MHKAYKKGFISSAATDDILTGADPENAPKVKDPRMYSKRAQKLVERVAKIRRHKELLAEFLKQGAWSVDLTSTDWIGRPIKRGKKSKRSPTPVDDPSMRSPLRTTDTSTQSPGSKRTVSAEKMVRRMTVNMADTVSRMTSLKHSHEKQRVEIAALIEERDMQSVKASRYELEQTKMEEGLKAMEVELKQAAAASASASLQKQTESSQVKAHQQRVKQVLEEAEEIKQRAALEVEKMQKQVQRAADAHGRDKSLLQSAKQIQVKHAGIMGLLTEVTQSEKGLEKEAKSAQAKATKAKKQKLVVDQQNDLLRQRLAASQQKITELEGRAKERAQALRQKDTRIAALEAMARKVSTASRAAHPVIKIKNNKHKIPAAKTKTTAVKITHTQKITAYHLLPPLPPLSCSLLADKAAAGAHLQTRPWHEIRRRDPHRL